jgi:hypothetical protein
MLHIGYLKRMHHEGDGEKMDLPIHHVAPFASLERMKSRQKELASQVLETCYLATFMAPSILSSHISPYMAAVLGRSSPIHICLEAASTFSGLEN